MTINEHRSNSYEKHQKKTFKKCFSQCLCFTNIMLLTIHVALRFETAIMC